MTGPTALTDYQLDVIDYARSLRTNPLPCDEEQAENLIAVLNQLRDIDGRAGRYAMTEETLVLDALNECEGRIAGRMERYANRVITRIIDAGRRVEIEGDTVELSQAPIHGAQRDDIIGQAMSNYIDRYELHEFSARSGYFARIVANCLSDYRREEARRPDRAPITDEIKDSATDPNYIDPAEDEARAEDLWRIWTLELAAISRATGVPQNAVQDIAAADPSDIISARYDVTQRTVRNWRRKVLLHVEQKNG